jgi:hypothetical protein
MSQDLDEEQMQMVLPPYTPREGLTPYQDVNSYPDVTHYQNGTAQLDVTTQQEVPLDPQNSAPLVVIDPPLSQVFRGRPESTYMNSQKRLVFNPAFTCPGAAGGPHAYENRFTACGIVWLIFFFPLGFICFWNTRKHVCVLCGRDSNRDDYTVA